MPPTSPFVHAMVNVSLKWLFLSLLLEIFALSNPPRKRVRGNMIIQPLYGCMGWAEYSDARVGIGMGGDKVFVSFLLCWNSLNAFYVFRKI